VPGWEKRCVAAPQVALDFHHLGSPRHYERSKMSTSGPSFAEQLAGLGRRARALRLQRDVAQRALAARAGVGLATLRRFERTGRASMETVLRVALALEAEAGLERLFELPRYTSLDEALARPARAPRQRAGRR
jgi:hypothetical protein